MNVMNNINLKFESENEKITSIDDTVPCNNENITLTNDDAVPLNNPKLETKNSIYGFSLIMVSIIGFCFNIHLVKYLEINGVDGYQLVLFRSIILITFDMTYIWYNNLTKDFFTTLKENLYLMTMRGVIGSFAFILIYYITAFAPLGEMTSILSLNIIFTPILGYYYLDEIIGKDFIIYIVMIISGISLIERPYFIFKYFENDPELDQLIKNKYPNRLLGLHITLGVSFLFSVITTLLRKMKNIRSEYSTMSFGFCGLLYASIGYFFVDIKRITEPIEWITLITIGIVGVIQQESMSKSLQHTEAYVNSIFSQTQVLINFIGDYYVYGTKVNNTSYYGATIIVAVSLIIIGKKSFC